MKHDLIWLYNGLSSLKRTNAQCTPLTDRELDHEGVHDAPDDGDKVERVPAVLEVTLPRNE